VANKIIFEVQATAKGLKVVSRDTEKLVKNTDKAQKSTDKLRGSRDKYMRTEKGVAGISSNSTKNFSKMQQSIDGGGGGGGLVRAYALLAANVFALTAAFGVLSRSAQIDTLTQSMERLSATGGASISAISRDLVEASGGAISFANSMRQVALATSAGLGAEQIQGLTTVAKGAAIALGRDLNDSLDRIFRGAIKLEPELLDEIGLFVRVDEESSKYARTLGKSVTSLTQYEKRQAFLNGVLEQGTKKFQDFAEQVDPDPYSKLAAALGDIAQNVTSFVNKALGPLVSFLAESRGLLLGVFGVVAAILIKQAVPALGAFTRGLENSAIEALKDRDIFVKAQNDKVAAAKAAALAQKDAAIQAQAETAKAAQFTGPRFVSKAKGALDIKTLDKEVNALDRQRIIRKRINDLERSAKKVKGENATLVANELNALKEEERELQKIIDLEKQRATIKKAPAQAGKGTIADIENQRSLNSAIVAGGTAAVLTTAQTQGLGAGFKEFFTTLRKGEVEIDGNTQKLKGFSKASFALKGGLGLLGAGFQRLMMFLGPVGIAFSLIAPFLPALARAFGLVTKESDILNKSFNELTEQQKNLRERFDIQTTAITNQKLAYVEVRKAILAYNTTNNETFKLIQQTSKDLLAFQRNLSGLGAAWEGFKSIFGLDKESKIIKTQAEAVKDSLQAAIQTEDEGILKIFKDAGVESESFKTAIDNATAAESQFEKAQKELNTTGSTRIKKLEQLAKKQITGNNLTTQESVLKASLNDTEKVYVNTLANQIKTADALEKERKNLNITENQANKIAKDGIPITKERIEAEQKRVSALEGSREAVSKFQAAFQQTTKIDEVTSSLNQLKSSIIDGTDQKAAEDFFATFGDTQNNPIALIFTKEQIEEIEKGGAQAKQTFKEVVDQFNDLRASIATSKDELAILNSKAKQFAVASQVGGAAATVLAKTQTEIAEKQKEIASSEYQSFLLSQGLGDAEAERLSKITTRSDFEKEALALGKDGIDVEKVRNEFIKNQNANLEYQFTLNTESLRVKQSQAQADQKILDINKETQQITAKRLELEAKIDQFKRTGTTELDPSKEFELQINAAKASRDLALEEAKIKKTLIDVEFALLYERVKLLGLESERETEILKNLAIAQFNAKKNVDDAVANASKGVTVAVIEGLAKGINEAKGGDFVGGLRTTISAATDVEGADGAAVTTAEKIAVATAAMETFRETLMSLGPQGEAIMAFSDGALTIASAMNAFKESTNMEDKLAAVGQAIGAVSSIMAANSKAQIAEIDRQIEAEKKRDGKSKESVAKIKAMEQKKEAIAKKAFEQQKKMQIAQTIISTATAVMQTLSASGLGWFATPLAIAVGAMGAAQLALIKKQQYQGAGGSDTEAPMTALTIGSRSSAVDVSRRATSGELNYLRGGRTTGQGLGGAGASLPGGAMGRRGYANGGEGILVGERGPEVVSPSMPVDITPNYALGGGSTNVNFTINAVDGQSVQNMLYTQRGNIIGMIREAANANGEGFLESVDPAVYGGGG